MTKEELITMISDAYLENLEISENITSAEKELKDYCLLNDIDYIKVEEMVNVLTAMYFEEGVKKGIEAMTVLVSK